MGLLHFRSTLSSTNLDRFTGFHSLLFKWNFFSVIKARILGRRKLTGAPSTECRVYKVKVLQDYKVFPYIIIV